MTTGTDVSLIKGLGFVPLKQESRIRAAEAERVRQGVLDRHGALRIRDVVEIAVLVGALLVGRRRGDLVVHREGGDAGFESAGRAEQVPGYRLGGRHGDLPRVVAERPLDGE